MPMIPLNAFDPSAPISGCTNEDNDRMERDLLATMVKPAPSRLEDNDRHERMRALGYLPIFQTVVPSEASLMLADFAIPYPTADEAQVVMLENEINRECEAGIYLTDHATDAELYAAFNADVLEASRDQRARDWLASLPAAQA